MKGLLERDFFDNVAPHLETILKNTTSSITLHIEEFHEAQLQHLQALLDRLSRYGDRINIALDESLRDMAMLMAPS